MPDLTPAPRRAHAALLMCDVVGSTALITRLGDERAADLLQRFDRVARDLLEAYGGREIDRTDGFLLLFDRTADALCYAEALHTSLRDVGEPSGVDLTVRVGIHFGEVLLRDNPEGDVRRGAKPLEVEGIAKPLAARVMSLARGGQTLLTETAADLARRGLVDDKADWTWVRRGSFRLKGIAEPTAVWEAAADRPPSRRLFRSAGTWRWVAAALALALVVAAVVGGRAWLARTPDLEVPPVAFADARAQTLFEEAWESWLEGDAQRALRAWRQADRIDDTSPTHWLLGALLAEAPDNEPEYMYRELRERSRAHSHPHARALQVLFAGTEMMGPIAERQAYVKQNLPPATDALLFALRAGALGVIDPEATFAAAAASPALMRPQLWVARVRQTRDDPRADDAFRRAIALAPVAPAPHFYYVGYLYQLQRWDDLAEALETGLEVAPQSRLRTMAAELALRDGDLEAFEEHFTVSQSLGRTTQARMIDSIQIGGALVQAGLPDRGFAVLAEALEDALAANEPTYALGMIARNSATLAQITYSWSELAWFVARSEELLTQPGIPTFPRNQAATRLFEYRITLAIQNEDFEAADEELAKLRQVRPENAGRIDLSDFLRRMEAWVEATRSDSVEAIEGLWADRARPTCGERLEASFWFEVANRPDEAAPYVHDFVDDPDCLIEDTSLEGRWNLAEVLAAAALDDLRYGEPAKAKARAERALALLPLADPDFYVVRNARAVLSVVDE
ncbi:MAG: adenylate/guanylate cyclase domain-containing protein [Myxococcota bacterium]